MKIELAYQEKEIIVMKRRTEHVAREMKCLLVEGDGTAAKGGGGGGHPQQSLPSPRQFPTTNYDARTAAAGAATFAAAS